MLCFSWRPYAPKCNKRKFDWLILCLNALVSPRRLLRQSCQSSFISSNLIHNSYINSTKLNASTCFGHHPPILRRSMSLIIHACRGKKHIFKKFYIDNTRLYNFTLWHSDSTTQCYTTTHSCFLFNKMITYSKYNKAIIRFYRMRIPEAAYMYN